MYLVYSYQYNKELLSKGPYRGHDEELIGHYRRECLLVSVWVWVRVCVGASAPGRPFAPGVITRSPLPYVSRSCVEWHVQSEILR